MNCKGELSNRQLLIAIQKIGTFSVSRISKKYCISFSMIYLEAYEFWLIRKIAIFAALSAFMISSFHVSPGIIALSLQALIPLNFSIVYKYRFSLSNHLLSV